MFNPKTVIVWIIRFIRYNILYIYFLNKSNNKHLNILTHIIHFLLLKHIKENLF